MRKDPFSKLQSSLSLEGLLDQPVANNTQNWLLTYLDVFVLIVMLVITLITLSDINTEQQHAATQPQKICPPVSDAANCPSVAVAEDKSAPPITTAEQAMTIEPGIADTKEGNDSAFELSDTAAIKMIAETATNPIHDLARPHATDEEILRTLAKAIDDFGLSNIVNIKIIQGYAQLEIQDKLLFKSSDAELTADGGALLKQLTPLLRQAIGLILIEGHTDNMPIKTAQFPSNWELGSSRATSVLHFLVLQQLDSSRLRAITYADTMPIADNETEEGREKNRRVNILIKLSE
ncbi:MAG: OmpA family protein [Methylobacter sp.]|nr:OmpA family protein [Methylobacter sp.]MDP2428445.1 OmpA family protein [Methylobacter sp.]MDP3053426.1 OmpA family protein [Methylobacter sp.]MDP3361624.1 OmpA family protein [Methylobacter sp.]MDZ4220703.1 OmpA family protein [Methylobacter sp.]